MVDRANELRELLNEWDFIGVFDPATNTDEYDCMIRPLITRLVAGADTNAIARFLDEELTSHFGLSPGVAETAPMAARLTAWWHSDRP